MTPFRLNCHDVIASAGLYYSTRNNAEKNLESLKGRKKGNFHRHFIRRFEQRGKRHQESKEETWPMALFSRNETTLKEGSAHLSVRWFVMLSLIGQPGVTLAVYSAFFHFLLSSNSMISI